jgi:hypothetical protein
MERTFLAFELPSHELWCSSISGNDVVLFSASLEAWARTMFNYRRGLQYHYQAEILPARKYFLTEYINWVKI